MSHTPYTKLDDGQDCSSTPLVVVAPSSPHLTRGSAVFRHSSSGGGGAAGGSAKAGTKQRSFGPSTLSAPATPRAASKRSWQALLTPLACLCWVACSSGAILVNKHILVDLNFPFPCTVAALGITGTSIISCLAVRLLRLGSSSSGSSAKGNSSGNKAGVSWWFYCTYIVPAGLCVALAMQLGNTAYLYLSVAYVQMLKAFTPVVTMLFAFLFKLERPSLLLVCAVGLITAGVAVASWGEGSINVTGVAAMVASLVCEALRLVLMQSLVSKREVHPVQTLAYIAPAATAWMVLIAGLTEALPIHQSGALHDIAKHPLALAASAAAGFGANAMAMLVISLSGALTLKCLGLAKDVGLVVVGVVLLGEVVSTSQGLGYGISLLGFLLYNAARMWAGGSMQVQNLQQDSSSRAGLGRSSKPAAADKARRSSGNAKGGGGLLRAHYPVAASSGREAAESRPLLRTPRTPPAAAAAGMVTSDSVHAAPPAGTASAAASAASVRQETGATVGVRGLGLAHPKPHAAAAAALPVSA